jgi:SAM-dependent methyltransferase
MTTFDTLADYYDAGRIGYANELYDFLVGYGLSPSHRILDVGCGTGLASRPLIDNGFRVTGVDVSEPMLERARASLPDATWIAGSAEALPFDDGSFDAVISAQALHHADRAAALREIVRVTRSGGIVAIWWKSLNSLDPVKMTRDDVSRDLGVEPPVSGYSRGFREFYATDFADRTLRVIPWNTVTGLDEFMNYERSRKTIRDAFGDRADEYFAALEQRLRDRFGDGNPWIPLGFTHFLYAAKTR